MINGSIQTQVTMHSDPSIRHELQQLDDDELTRFLRTLSSAGGKVVVDDQPFLNFSSNDYLNLASDLRLKEAAKKSVDEFGCGATASRLMAGHLTIHAELEARLADWTGMEAALVFPSGFQANLGMLTTLAEAHGAVLSDALNHASIVDGCRLAKADTYIYPHCDALQAAALMKKLDVSGRRVVVTDTLFSMDGDHAPIEALSALTREHNAYLAVDEAHALGVFGNGRGLCHETGIRSDIIVGTLTKSLGSGGGFVAGSKDFIDLLLNKARSFIYSTGLAPPCAGSALEALRILEAEPGLGEELLSRSDFLRAQCRERGVEVPKDRSQIIPITIGSNATVMALSRALYDQGILVAGVRPPTVPEGTARLRISVTLAHEEADLVRLADTLAAVLAHAGIAS